MGFVIRFTPVYIYTNQVYVAAGAGAGANEPKDFFQERKKKNIIIIVGMGD